MWMLLPLRLVVAHDLLECKYMHGWRHGKIVLFALFNMARGFEYACEIISDKTSESLLKSLAGTVRVKGGMSLRNGMWHGLRNDIIMQNVKYGNWRKEIN